MVSVAACSSLKAHVHAGATSSKVLILLAPCQHARLHHICSRTSTSAIHQHHNGVDFFPLLIFVSFLIFHFDVSLFCTCFTKSFFVEYFFSEHIYIFVVVCLSFFPKENNKLILQPNTKCFGRKVTFIPHFPLTSSLASRLSLHPFPGPSLSMYHTRGDIQASTARKPRTKGSLGMETRARCSHLLWGRGQREEEGPPLN